MTNIEKNNQTIKSDTELRRNTMNHVNNDSLAEKKDTSQHENTTDNSFIKKKRRRIKLRKITSGKNRAENKTISIPKEKMAEEKELSSNKYTSEISQTSNDLSEESVKSLTQLQIESLKKNRKNIIIKDIKTGKKIDLEKIVELLKLKDKINLNKYKFPYMSQSDFNYNIYNSDIKLMRSLYFACPICQTPYRHFSMAFHIFQYHFEYIEKFLSQRDIAHSCAKLMENEFKKIENSIAIFSELAAVYQSCEFFGTSDWRANTDLKIDALKQLNIEKKFFRISKEEAFHLLTQKLPLNKNKRYKK